MTTQKEAAPVRASVYKTVEAARQAVQALRAAGFPEEAISVVCSEEHAHEHFGATVQQTGLRKAEPLLNSAGVAGLGLGTAALATSIMLPGGAALFAVGAFTGLAIAGTLASLFASRSMDREATDFFEQSLQEGDLLVVVEIHGDDAAQGLARAEKIFRETGAKPLPLAE
jgi:hypothetical protein